MRLFVFEKRFTYVIGQQTFNTPGEPICVIFRELSIKRLLVHCLTFAENFATEKFVFLQL